MPFAWYRGNEDRPQVEGRVRMITASVAELQAALTTYLEQVQAGEQVLVTDQGREIARLVPSAGLHLQALDYNAMVATGLLIPAEEQPSPEFWSLPRMPDPENLLLKALLAEREESW